MLYVFSCLAVIAVPCNPPRKVDNAVIVGLYQKEYLSDSNATYQCRDKYIILDNEDTIQCKDGTWESKKIMCTRTYKTYFTKSHTGSYNDIIQDSKICCIYAA